jgi:class 3 adenylate cyclase
MRCPACQHENPAGQKFCGDCGARLASLCPSCNAPNPPGQKFCGECGSALGQPARAGVRFATPESYTPKHLAEKILMSKAALEGERKHVTVLFADLKGSMELLADRDPEEARKILDPVLELMMEAVHRYEGTVNQVMGDGIIALFGAPLALEDHPVRACYAALRMQEGAARYADELRRRRGVPMHIRVGLNSGEVVVRSIGSDLRMDYTAVGQTTHLAARMEQMAHPGSSLLTAATLTLAEGYVRANDRGGAGHLSALVLQEGDRELDGDALTILPHRGHGQQPLSVAGHPGGHDLTVAVPVSGAKALRDDQIQALSQGLVGRVPEHGLRPPVPQADHALPIGEDHSLRHLLHDPAKQPARGTCLHQPFFLPAIRSPVHWIDGRRRHLVRPTGQRRGRLGHRRSHSRRHHTGLPLRARHLGSGRGGSHHRAPRRLAQSGARQGAPAAMSGGPTEWLRISPAPVARTPAGTGPARSWRTAYAVPPRRSRPRLDV